MLKSKSVIKCNECNTDLTNLSALDFHHTERKIKKVSLGEIYNASLNNIIKALENENLKLICGNCHSKKQVKTFKRFEKLILKIDIFKSTPEEINRIIDNYLSSSLDLNQLTPSKRSSFKRQIKSWLKKRYIIEKIFDGACIGCGEIHVRNNLPSFDFHHRHENSEEAKSSWGEFRKYEITKINRILREEECVAICSNCHRIITHFRFIKHIDKILGKNYEIIRDKAKLKYKKIVSNINNFKFKNVEIKDPLKKQIEYGEGWKKYLNAIYEIIKEKNNLQFTSKELTLTLKISINSINSYLKKLVNLDLIILFKETENIREGKLIMGVNPRIYELTELGIKEAKLLD